MNEEMEDSKAIEVLANILKNDSLPKEDREAITVALRVLMLTVQTSDSYLKKLKAKRDRNLE